MERPRQTAGAFPFAFPHTPKFPCTLLLLCVFCAGSTGWSRHTKKQRGCVRVRPSLAAGQSKEAEGARWRWGAPSRVLGGACARRGKYGVLRTYVLDARLHAEPSSTVHVQHVQYMSAHRRWRGTAVSRYVRYAPSCNGYYPAEGSVQSCHATCDALFDPLRDLCASLLHSSRNTLVNRRRPPANGSVTKEACIPSTAPCPPSLRLLFRPLRLR